MKTQFITCTCMFLFSFTAFSQSGWFWNQPLPQGNTLRGVDYYTADCIAAVGECATLIQSTDRGLHWNVRHYITGGNQNLYSVQFITPQVGYIVGQSGIIIKTTDGGKTWLPQTSNTNVLLYSVHFINEITGIAVGDAGVILRTADGGAHWNRQNSKTSENLFAVTFSDSLHGTSVGDHGTILRTTDTGITWDTQISHTLKPLLGVSFLDKNNGLVVGVALLHTTNGGATWDSLGPGTDLPLFSAHLFTKDEYIICGGSHPYGAQGIISRSTDDGKTWSQRISETLTLYSSSFNNPNGCAVGMNGTILLTSDRGVSWDLQYRTGTSGYGGIKFGSPSIGYIADGYGQVLKTTDGGVTWFTIRSGGLLNFVMALSVTNDTTVMLAGSFMSGGVLRSNDGGQTWMEQSNGLNEELGKISFRDNNNGAVLGGSDGIFITSDAGSHWNKYQSGTSQNLYNIFIIDRNILYAVGDSGTIIKTTDGGQTWTKQTSGTLIGLNQVFFTDQNTGHVLGTSIALKTTNGGNSWTQQMFTPYFAAYDLHFIDKNNGLAVGFNGEIYRTFDAGVSWQKQKSGTKNTFRGAFLKDNINGFIVGDAQIILQTKTGGVVSVKDNILQQSNDFTLSQNYPNPFGTSSINNNTNTTIQYLLPKQSHVRLVVTNLLGQEIQTLVNQTIDSGDHSVQFNANHLPSGLYFYRLETEKNVIVKKMMVIR